MSRHVPIDPALHRELRVITARGLAYGDGAMLALTFPAEFRSLQAHYPIVFQKNTVGEVLPVVLLGLREGENLFLQGSHWDADYLPMAVERQPFLIGRDGAALSVHIDLDSPRISSTVGEALFAVHGGTTPFLERMSALLGTLHEGMAAVPAFVAALLQHDLLESFVLDVGGADAGAHRLAGFYTIHEERLAGLAPEALVALHRDGHLLPIHMAIASLSQFRALIARSQRTLRYA
ncbi:MAG: SapC family protein [Arenimonas sp.]|nr:SapC family protein [Arenimonas sp.]